MRKILLFGTVLFMGLGAVAQAPRVNLDTKMPAQDISAQLRQGISAERNLTCVDTVRYPLSKEIDFTPNWTPSFYTIPLWRVDNEAISQTFQHSGGTITINGVEFLAVVSDDSGPATVTTQASIYSVNANNNPVTLLGSGMVTVSNTANLNYTRVTFATPVTVTGNYAIVIKPTNTNAVLDIAISDVTPNQIQDENLSRYTSTFYDSSNGAWVSIPVLTSDTSNFDDVLDFEPIVAPMISYNIATNFTVAPATLCSGSPVNFTNTTAPMGVLSSRMYNYNVYRDYFNFSTSDSTYAWDLGITPQTIVWAANASHSYAAAGSYTPTLFTLAGFWRSCIDNKEQTITVNAGTNPTFSYASNTFCQGGTNPVPTVSSPGTFSGSAGLNFVSTTTGEINLTTTLNGTYTVTYTTSGACSATSSQTVTVTSAPDADFTYSAAAFCANGTNPLPMFGTGSSAGTFSSTTGLALNGGTGEVNLAASTPGTYTVTNAIAASGSCPASSATFDVTVNPTPTVNAVANQAVCAGAASTAITFGSNVTGATFAWSNNETGIGLGASGNGNIASFTATNGGTAPVAATVTVTPTANGCMGSASTFMITVNPIPTANAVNNVSVCNGVATSAINFGSNVTGTTFAWTNSQTGIGLGAAGNGNIASFTATNTTGAAVTSTIMVTPTAAGCAGTPVSFTVTVNPSPAVTLTGLPTMVCVYGADVTLNGGTPAGGAYTGTGVMGTTFKPATAGVGNATVTYSYTDPASNCAGMATASIEVSQCLGVDENPAAGNLVLYPNPAAGQVTFRFSGTAVEQATVTIISLDGKVVYQNCFNGNQGTLDVSTLARSTYFVRIKANDKETTSKLVLN